MTSPPGPESSLGPSRSPVFPTPHPGSVHAKLSVCTRPTWYRDFRTDRALVLLRVALAFALDLFVLLHSFLLLLQYMYSFTVFYCYFSTFQASRPCSLVRPTLSLFVPFRAVLLDIRICIPSDHLTLSPFPGLVVISGCHFHPTLSLFVPFGLFCWISGVAPFWILLILAPFFGPCCPRITGFSAPFGFLYSSVLLGTPAKTCWASFGTGFLEVWTFLRGFLPILRFSASPISAFPKKPVSVGVFVDLLSTSCQHSSLVAVTFVCGWLSVFS